VKKTLSPQPHAGPRRPLKRFDGDSGYRRQKSPG
jgi:hypothetical protein